MDAGICQRGGFRRWFPPRACPPGPLCWGGVRGAETMGLVTTFKCQVYHLPVRDLSGDFLRAQFPVCNYPAWRPELGAREITDKSLRALTLPGVH